MDGVFYRIQVCNKFDDVDDYNNLENPLLIELLKKIIDVKPTIFIVNDSGGGKFSTSAIKWM